MRNFTVGISTTTVFFIFFFMASAVVVNAQTKSDLPPAWRTSKDVQRIANKRLFTDARLRQSHIKAKSIAPTWMISKRVGQPARKEKLAENNLKSSGTPSWIISKGVQRLGRE
ncbi:MAG: hypothetical protein OEV74_17155 [Cyclobacteriaceae bacterium]|nr:hypothetical protein [Cyclobacteriaceae bacterium]MDH4298010.1 hypothetical protein [Cyclobacteriaceae bacterium]MDH5251068.1 hypothetical protein [Cyclobacteriaceae bacterium]